MSQPSMAVGKKTAGYCASSKRLLLAYKIRGVQHRYFPTPFRCSANGVRSVTPGRPTTPVLRKLVLRRTSEHWWEDEQEFDAITEVVVPKRLHVASAAPAAPDGPPLEHPASWGPVDDVALSSMMEAAGGKFASGFTSSKLKEEAAVLWRRLRQDGPPFFRKVRTRTTLDVLEDESAGPDAVACAAEELWGELCGQSWRVELDYGLAGSEAEPRDELLLACSWLGATRMLSHAGLSTDDAAARRAGVFVVHVPGYNASEQGAEDGFGATRSWRDLRPRLLAFAPADAAAAAAAAPGASLSRSRAVGP